MVSAHGQNVVFATVFALSLHDSSSASKRFAGSYSLTVLGLGHAIFKPLHSCLTTNFSGFKPVALWGYCDRNTVSVFQ